MPQQSLYIENVRFSGSEQPVSLSIEAGLIRSVDASSTDIPSAVSRHNGGGRLITPGLIDIHVHGIKEYQFDRSEEDILSAAPHFAEYGTTTILPTLVPNTTDSGFLKKIESRTAVLERIRRVHVPGLHLEGPFVKEGGAACTPTPGDLGLLDEILKAGQGKIAAVSVSPDTENIVPVIEKLREEGISVFMTHTRAGWDETVAAIEAGARHATHFYNVFYEPPEQEKGCRPVGAFEAIYADPRCSASFICDGVHVHQGAIKAFVTAKGAEAAALITDASVGAGLPAGSYETPWGFPVTVSQESGVRNADPESPKYGRLAGSCLTMDRGINKLMEWLDIEEKRIWAMGTEVPAAIIGLSDRGKIEAGMYADLVFWNRENGIYKPVCTLLAGECLYQRPDIEIF
jgi:N-acetylglucosamine-6-phosphate deacetylase